VAAALGFGNIKVHARAAQPVNGRAQQFGAFAETSGRVDDGDGLASHQCFNGEVSRDYGTDGNNGTDGKKSLLVI
jgi:hypothetical protein